MTGTYITTTKSNKEFEEFIDLILNLINDAIASFIKFKVLKNKNTVVSKPLIFFWYSFYITCKAIIYFIKHNYNEIIHRNYTIYILILTVNFIIDLIEKIFFSNNNQAF